MKKALVVLGMLFGLAVVSRAGTPQENGQLPFQAASFSGNSIFTSTASASSAGASITLTVSTPTAINSGGGTYSGRNCFTRILVQMSTYTVLTVVDGNTTKWTVFGTALGASGVNTLSLPEDHLGPLCAGSGDSIAFILTNTNGTAQPEAVDVEGYTTYGGTLNSGPMY